MHRRECASSGDDSALASSADGSAVSDALERRSELESSAPTSSSSDQPPPPHDADSMDGEDANLSSPLKRRRAHPASGGTTSSSHDAQSTRAKRQARS